MNEDIKKTSEEIIEDLDEEENPWPEEEDENEKSYFTKKL